MQLNGQVFPPESVEVLGAVHQSDDQAVAPIASVADEEITVCIGEGEVAGRLRVVLVPLSCSHATSLAHNDAQY